MKIFDGLKRFVGGSPQERPVTNSPQNDAEREANLRQNEEQIKIAIQQGHAVAADHTRLAQIRQNLANIQAKRDSPATPAPVAEAPIMPAASGKDTIKRRLDGISRGARKK